MKIFSALKFLLPVFLLLFAAKTYAEAPEKISGVKSIDSVAAKALYQQGAVFIDVRDKFSWSAGHIAGSVNLDFNDDAFIILYVSDELDKNTPLVFYCDSALEPNAAMASFFAASWGYKQVYYFRDGYYSWLAADFPVEYQLASQ
jgi:rhodanese-related sulfurtransferase